VLTVGVIVATRNRAIDLQLRRPRISRTRVFGASVVASQSMVYRHENGHGAAATVQLSPRMLASVPVRGLWKNAGGLELGGGDRAFDDAQVDQRGQTTRSRRRLDCRCGSPESLGHEFV
jgi:hypothetical protein